MDLLNDNPVCVLSGDEFSPVEGKGFKTQVDEYFQKIGRNVTTPFGIVTLDMKGIRTIFIME